MPSLLHTHLPLPVYKIGKVRDLYEIEDDKLLIISTDRISAYDVVMLNGIPDKGKVLSQISSFWLKKTKNIVPNHFLTDDPDQYPEPFKDYREQIEGRSMLCLKTRLIPMECVVRGYLLGSALKMYEKTGGVYGIKLPAGLKKGSKLPFPIFTPAIKREKGHDENISFERLKEIIGERVANKVREYSMKLYSLAYSLLKEKGITLTDTKFEFGEYKGRIIQIDESITPDSSRYEPDLSKQPVRDWLDSIHFDHKTPISLPEEVVKKTRDSYLKILEIIRNNHKFS